MRSHVWFAVALVCASACGGGYVRPAPLKYTFEAKYIALVPLNEKQVVVDAQQDFDVAQMQQDKAEADLLEIDGGSLMPLAHFAGPANHQVEGR